MLKPSGSLHLVDFASHGEGLHGRLQRLFRASASVRERLSDDLAALLLEAGFGHRELVRRDSLLGPQSAGLSRVVTAGRCCRSPRRTCARLAPSRA